MRFNYSKGALSALFTVLLATMAFSQAIISGTVVDDSNSPIYGAEVSVVGTQTATTTDLEGFFTLSTAESDGVLEIVDAISGTRQIRFQAEDQQPINLGTITLSGDGVDLASMVVVGRGVIDLSEDRSTPVAANTIYREEIQEKAQGNVEFPEILKNTPSVYVSNQAGGFGEAQMFIRGYDQTNSAFLLNGQPINGMEDGKVYWSNWSGMTDIANAVQIQRGLGSSKLAISSVGGTVNIVTKATEKKQGGYGQFIVGNDSYFKGAIGYNTGLMDNGWGLSIALSHNQGFRKWAEGTRGQGQSYFLSFGKKFNNHNINFLITGAPQWHDQNFSQDEKVYQEKGKKYNNNFGFDANGEYLTMRRNYYHKPVTNLNWDWEINPDMNLSTVLYASFGRGGGTGGYGTGYRNTEDGYIDWNAIRDYNKTVVAPAQVAGGQSLPANFTGNNIGYLYYNDFYDFRDPGMAGNVNADRERQRAGLVLRASVNNHFWYGGVTNFNYDVNENLSFNLGADIRSYKGDHFRQVIDFLGLEGYYDNDSPSQRGIVTESFEANPWSALTDFADEDQRIQYDFSETINYQGAFGQIEYKNDVFSTFFQGSLSNQNYQREDRYNFDIAKESEKVSKIGYNLKAGAAISFNEFNRVFGNVGYYSRQPFLDNIFTGNINDNTELISPEIDNEEIMGYELGYKYATSSLNINLNLYHTTWDNRSVSRFNINNNGTPSDVSDDFYQQDLARGVKQIHKGAEIDFYSKVATNFKLKGYFAYGDWKYDGIESTEVRNNDTGELISSGGSVDNSEVHVSNAPQVNFGLGFDFNILKSLSIDSDFNYYGKNYRFVTFNSREGAGTIAPYTSMDAGITYEIPFGEQKIKLRGNVYNVLNNLPITQSSRYGVYFANGRTWNASIRYEF
ncbi:TonB-dependent receptor [Flavobacteriaceae bacterium Ap0902]|nr:TonB-dependent receptor [Flavobacteriaceae bacterium Ap0902]